MISKTISSSTIADAVERLKQRQVTVDPQTLAKEVDPTSSTHDIVALCSQFLSEHSDGAAKLTDSKSLGRAGHDTNTNSATMLKALSFESKPKPAIDAETSAVLQKFPLDWSQPALQKLHAKLSKAYEECPAEVEVLAAMSGLDTGMIYWGESMSQLLLKEVLHHANVSGLIMPTVELMLDDLESRKLPPAKPSGPFMVGEKLTETLKAFPLDFKDSGVHALIHHLTGAYGEDAGEALKAVATKASLYIDFIDFTLPTRSLVYELLRASNSAGTTPEFVALALQSA